MAISTPHGGIKTAYIGAATAATMKTLTNAEIDALGAQSILANTYHLMLRPGTGPNTEKAGGIHKFMNYHKPMYTEFRWFSSFIHSAWPLKKVWMRPVIRLGDHLRMLS